MAAGTAHAPGRGPSPAPAADPDVNQIMDQGIAALKPVSYTHLTLPTSDLV